MSDIATQVLIQRSEKTLAKTKGANRDTPNVGSLIGELRWALEVHIDEIKYLIEEREELREDKDNQIKQLIEEREGWRVERRRILDVHTRCAQARDKFQSEADRLRHERDEVRRMWCEAEVVGNSLSVDDMKRRARAEAERRGWDCYEEDCK